MKDKMPVSFYDEISRNKRNSFFLMSIIFIVFVALGYAISFVMGEGYFFIIMILAIVFSLGYILIGYYKSDKLAIASVGAKPASRKEHKQFYDSVEGLILASGMPMPGLYVMPSKQINAFASGRSPEKAVICVTEGALEKLDKYELEGVLAHELSHIANYDIRYMTFATIMVGMIAIISEIFLRSLWFSGGGRDNKNSWIFLVIGIALAILAPIIVKLVQLAISRKREYAADSTAVKFTRYPKGLVGALKKIKLENKPMTKKEVSGALAPLFISNPFKGLGSTHPPIDKRIEILERM